MSHVACYPPLFFRRSHARPLKSRHNIRIVKEFVQHKQPTRGARLKKETLKAAREPGRNTPRLHNISPKEKKQSKVRVSLSGIRLGFTTSSKISRRYTSKEGYRFLCTTISLAVVEGRPDKSTTRIIVDTQHCYGTQVEVNDSRKCEHQPNTLHTSTCDRGTRAVQQGT